MSSGELGPWVALDCEGRWAQVEPGGQGGRIRVVKPDSDRFKRSSRIRRGDSRFDHVVSGVRGFVGDSRDRCYSSI